MTVLNKKSHYIVRFNIHKFLKKLFYWLCYYSCPISPPPSLPSALHTPSHPHSSPLVHVHGLFFVFYISCTILTLPLPSPPPPFSTYHLCYLFSVYFPPFSPLHHLPTDNPLCDLHFWGSVPVLVICLVCFCVLVSVVDSYEFVVILLFIFFIIFFLGKSL